MADYLHGSVLLYLDKLIDWGDYFARTKGDGVDASAERQALRSLLETCAEICAKIEPEARAGWWEPARLEHGEVVHPPHVQHGYERLREAGLVSASAASRCPPSLPTS